MAGFKIFQRYKQLPCYLLVIRGEVEGIKMMPFWLEQLGKKWGLTRVETLNGKQIWRNRDMISSFGKY